MKKKLLEIGNELAMLYGGSCYDCYKSGRKIIFKCIEHGEKFVMSMTAKELKDVYGIDITAFDVADKTAGDLINRHTAMSYVAEQRQLYKGEDDKQEIVDTCTSVLEGVPSAFFEKMIPETEDASKDYSNALDAMKTTPENPKNITIAVYYFGDDKIVFKKPFPIVRETEKCFYSDYASVRKETLGKVIFRKGEGSPYLVIETIDKNEEELRILFADWFATKANQMKG